MSDIEGRMGCGCEFRFTQHGWWRDACPSLVTCLVGDDYDGHRMGDAVRVGYALAARDGLGPWAASFPGRKQADSEEP